MITIVNADDWCGVYSDGKLLGQGHSFQEEELLRLLGIEAESFWVADPTYILGSFPHDLSELEAEGWKRV